MPHSTPPSNDKKSVGEKPVQNLGLTFNWADWLPYFEDADIPDAQKQEMIETLWHIIVAFVDLCFELNPTQQAKQVDGQQSCGQILDLKQLLEAAVIKSATAKQARHLACKPKHKEPKP